MTVCFHFVPKASTARRVAAGFALFAAAAAGGCANDSPNFFTTGSLSQPTPVAAAPTADPACVSLSSQIDALRKEGSVERLEKAADGKTPAVNVRRASLAKQAQLNKLNAEFIAKCGPALPKAQTTAALAQPISAAPPAAAKTATQPAKMIAKTTAAKETGVTIAAPAQN